MCKDKLVWSSLVIEGDFLRIAYGLSFSDAQFLQMRTFVHLHELNGSYKMCLLPYSTFLHQSYFMIHFFLIFTEQIRSLKQNELDYISILGRFCTQQLFYFKIYSENLQKCTQSTFQRIQTKSKCFISELKFVKSTLDVRVCIMVQVKRSFSPLTLRSCSKRLRA